jgi:hypothetical protein
MLELDNGLMPGNLMLTGWKNMQRAEQYENKYLARYSVRRRWSVRPPCKSFIN